MEKRERSMEGLSKREKVLVSIGAALGSSCIPCVVFHIKEAIKIGVDDGQIREAVDLAGKVKRASAAEIQKAAYAQIGDAKDEIGGCVERVKPDCCG